jgi:hypothetical protein
LRGFETQRFDENDPDHPIHRHMCAGILQDLLALDNHRAVADVDVEESDDDEESDADAADAEIQYAIPPPPPINDFAQIFHFYNEYNNENYQQEAEARREEDEEFWYDLREGGGNDDNQDAYPAAGAAVADPADPEYNIIRYWFENDHQANEYLDIQEEQQRNRAAAGAHAYLGEEEYYNVIRG